MRFLQSLASEADIQLAQFEPSHYADPESADVRYYSALGVPAVVFGVQGHGLHGDDEYVELDSIERYSRSLRTFLKALEA
jgi:succinyl-diaminopimelate desuccinylase